MYYVWREMVVVFVLKVLIVLFVFFVIMLCSVMMLYGIYIVWIEVSMRYIVWGRVKE